MQYIDKYTCSKETLNSISIPLNVSWHISDLSSPVLVFHFFFIFQKNFLYFVDFQNIIRTNWNAMMLERKIFKIYFCLFEVKFIWKCLRKATIFYTHPIYTYIWSTKTFIPWIVLIFLFCDKWKLIWKCYLKRWNVILICNFIALWSWQNKHLKCVLSAEGKLFTCLINSLYLINFF